VSTDSRINVQSEEPIIASDKALSALSPFTEVTGASRTASTHKQSSAMC